MMRLLLFVVLSCIMGDAFAQRSTTVVIRTWSEMNQDDTDTTGIFHVSYDGDRVDSASFTRWDPEEEKWKRTVAVDWIRPALPLSSYDMFFYIDPQVYRMLGLQGLEPSLRSEYSGKRYQMKGPYPTTTLEYVPFVHQTRNISGERHVCILNDHGHLIADQDYHRATDFPYAEWRYNHLYTQDGKVERMQRVNASEAVEAVKSVEQYFYDEHGDLIEATYVTYSANSDPRLMRYLFGPWVKRDSTYQFGRQPKPRYGGTGFTIAIQQLWDAQLGVWDSVGFLRHEFNGPEGRVSLTEELYDDQKSGVEEYDRYEYEYYANGDLAKSTWYTSPSATKPYQIDSFVNRYHGDGRIDSIEHYYNGRLHRTYYFLYSGLASVRQQFEDERSATHIVSATIMLTAGVGSAKLYDITGRVVVAVNSNVSSIDVTHLPQGLYFLEQRGEVSKVLISR
jgi:hypothetical protein